MRLNIVCIVCIECEWMGARVCVCGWETVHEISKQNSARIIRCCCYFLSYYISLRIILYRSYECQSTHNQINHTDKQQPKNMKYISVYYYIFVFFFVLSFYYWSFDFVVLLFPSCYVIVILRVFFKYSFWYFATRIVTVFVHCLISWTKRFFFLLLVYKIFILY